MGVRLALQRPIDDRLGQPGQQPSLSGQGQTVGPSPRGELAEQLPVAGVFAAISVSALATGLDRPASWRSLNTGLQGAPPGLARGLACLEVTPLLLQSCCAPSRIWRGIRCS
jgi:hypothetical protein